MRLLRRRKFVIPAIAGILALIGAGVAYGLLHVARQRQRFGSGRTGF